MCANVSLINVVVLFVPRIPHTIMDRVWTTTAMFFLFIYLFFFNSLFFLTEQRKKKNSLQICGDRRNTFFYEFVNTSSSLDGHPPPPPELTKNGSPYKKKLNKPTNENIIFVPRQQTPTNSSVEPEHCIEKP